MKYLIDTNVLLLVLLDQDSSSEARHFFETVPMQQCVISDFSLHSIGVILARNERKEIFREFIEDLIIRCRVQVLHIRYEELYSVMKNMDRCNLDFDDAYQYTLAREYGLQIVSFDSDFDSTDKGRVHPADVSGFS
jgi:predicted nucleic acid-binding protein